METFFVAKVSITFFYRLSKQNLRLEWFHDKFYTQKRRLFFYGSVQSVTPGISGIKEAGKFKSRPAVLYVLILCSKPGINMRKWFSKLLQFFLQGLIILAPIVITIWALTSLFNFVDRILPDALERIFPQISSYYLPGMGLIVAILIIFLVGYVSSSFVVGKLVELFDNILQKTPGIKIIYSTVKDFFEAFAGNKRKFDKAVLVCVDVVDVWQIGFITHEELHEFGLHEYVAVYVPQSYAFTGRLYFVKKDRIKMIPDIGSADAMKFAISGGVTTIDEEHHEKGERS